MPPLRRSRRDWRSKILRRNGRRQLRTKGPLGLLKCRCCCSAWYPRFFMMESFSNTLLRVGSILLAWTRIRLPVALMSLKPRRVQRSLLTRMLHAGSLCIHYVSRCCAELLRPPPPRGSYKPTHPSRFTLIEGLYFCLCRANVRCQTAKTASPPGCSRTFVLPKHQKTSKSSHCIHASRSYT